MILPTFTLVTYDTSLGAGYLSADWVPTLNREIRTFPEAKGPIEIYCMGHGGWTSTDLLAGAGQVAQLRPTHIWTEGGAINDCFDIGSGPAVSRATHNANNQAMIAGWLASIPGVNTTMMTMSSVSAMQTGRAELANYYADELVTAAAMGIGSLNLYANWPKPLDGHLTHGAVPWSIPATSGFGPTDNQWSPTDHGSSISVSSDGLTLSSSSSTAQLARSLAAFAGKSHFEITLAGIAVTAVRIGIANSSANLNGTLGDDANGIGLDRFGRVFKGGASMGTAPFSLTGNDVIGVEVDWAARLVYFMKGAARSTGFAIPATWSSAGAAVSLNQTNGPATAKFSDEGDGLHPIWQGAVNTYSYPYWRALARAQMAAFWP